MLKELIRFIFWGTLLTASAQEVIVLNYEHLDYESINVYNYEDEQCEWICW